MTFDRKESKQKHRKTEGVSDSPLSKSIRLDASKLTRLLYLNDNVVLRLEYRAGLTIYLRVASLQRT